MKGYGVSSVLERASYSKPLFSTSNNSKRAILELDVYNRDNGIKTNLWQQIKRKKK